MKPSELLAKLKSFVAKDPQNISKLMQHFELQSPGTIRHWIKNKEVPTRNRKKLEAFLFPKKKGK